MTRKVEILYFEGCPNFEATRDEVRAVIAAVGTEVELREVAVRDDEDARRLRFLGSPTIRVDGVDIEPAADERSDFAMSCRTYAGSGVPGRQLLERALRPPARAGGALVARVRPGRAR